MSSLQVEEFHDGRKNVLDGRMENRAHRNDLKEQLLLTAENMQVSKRLGAVY